MRTLVIAPHPDDEILGVGGTLLKRKSEGCKLAWVIITKPGEILNWSDDKLTKRENQIIEITNKIGFDNVYKLNFSAAALSELLIPTLVKEFSKIIKDFSPNEIFFPHLGDVHTDHKVVHKAVISSTKSFRVKSIKRLIVYETLSETEYGLDRSKAFFPNLYIDISKFLEQKLNLMNIYSSEVDSFPFPRSREAILSLARYRGSSCNCSAAEAFEIIKQIE